MAKRAHKLEKMATQKILLNSECSNCTKTQLHFGVVHFLLKLEIHVLVRKKSSRLSYKKKNRTIKEMFTETSLFMNTRTVAHLQVHTF